MLFKIETCSPESELDAYRDWFERWRKFLPWETKRERVVGRLDRLSRRYREPFDPRVVPRVARKVAEAAMASGVAQIKIDDLDAYERAVAARIARNSKQ